MTLAFGTTAPVESVTVPLIAPWPPVCAIAGLHIRPAHNNSATAKNTLNTHRGVVTLTPTALKPGSLDRITALLKSFSLVLDHTHGQWFDQNRRILGSQGIYGSAETNVNRKIISSFENLTPEFLLRN
jgi:hypothetical protein